MSSIEVADICCGLAWGDEAKGKIVAQLIQNTKYDWVCRWAGGSNAGHTVYVNGKKYNTNIVPSGIFYGVKCYIGPDCYINIKDLERELTYLHENGFNIDLVKISPDVHLVTDAHQSEDQKTLKKSQGSTGKGIAPCARDKFARIGLKLKDYTGNTTIYKKEKHLLQEMISGVILCEGAQGFWLDINQGNYPYVTSSYTLPYSACSLGFPPQKIRHIYGAAKIYDTRVGIDPDFGDDLLDNEMLNKIALEGNEFGTTTGRARKVNWLNLEKLKDAVNISGTTHIIISKVDVLEDLGYFKVLNLEEPLKNIESLKNYITHYLKEKCPLLQEIIFSSSPDKI
jgi:adenylosuccinate synthase